MSATARLDRHRQLGYTSAMGLDCADELAMPGDALIFRTPPETEAGRCANGHPVAFEVDQVDDFLPAGWSVLVTGETTEITSDQLGCSTCPKLQIPGPWLVLDLPAAAVDQHHRRRVHQA